MLGTLRLTAQCSCSEGEALAVYHNCDKSNHREKQREMWEQRRGPPRPNAVVAKGSREAVVPELSPKRGRQAKKGRRTF